jgi:hypothetical protein
MTDKDLLLVKLDMYLEPCLQVLRVLRFTPEALMNTAELMEATNISAYDIAAVRSICCLMEWVKLKPGPRNSRLWAITARGRARIGERTNGGAADEKDVCAV